MKNNPHQSICSKRKLRKKLRKRKEKDLFRTSTNTYIYNSFSTMCLFSQEYIVTLLKQGLVQWLKVRKSQKEIVMSSIPLKTQRNFLLISDLKVYNGSNQKMNRIFIMLSILQGKNQERKIFGGIEYTTISFRDFPTFIIAISTKIFHYS